MGGSFLAMLDESTAGDIEATDAAKKIAVGNGKIDIHVLNQRLAAPGKARGKTKSSKKKPNWGPFVEAWRKRRERYESALAKPLVLTPTLLKQQKENGGVIPSIRSGFEREPALLVGDLAHRFLQTWGFNADVSSAPSQLGKFIDCGLPKNTQLDRNIIEAELQTIFRKFFSSTAYAELTNSRILGREVPFLMPWNGQIMEGVIDLIYERNGLLYAADYKTDRITKDQLAEGAARYRHQAEIYSQAVKQSLGRELAAFKIIFLRLGEAVESGADKNTELSLF
jgi:ATP-dependent helicase/nuclease subunit A